MKNIILAVFFLSTLLTAGCRTAHEAKEDTEYMAKKTGHAIGHATQKTGESISNAGTKLETKTAQ